MRRKKKHDFKHYGDLCLAEVKVDNHLKSINNDKFYSKDPTKINIYYERDLINKIEDGIIRKLLINHNNSIECRSVLNTNFFAFLDNDDYIQASMVCKLWYAEANSIKTFQTKYPIQLNNFTRKQRTKIWKYILLGEDKYCLRSEDEKMFETFEINKELEFTLNNLGILNYHDEILRDISRTFPKLKEFQNPENQCKMLKILFKISYALPNVGYCQGMNYIVGIFLYAFNFDVDQVYSSVMSILINWDYQKIYNKGLIRLREMCYIFNELIKLYLPELYNQIFNRDENEIEITSELFAIQWFLTLFTYDIADTDYAVNSILILDNIIIHDPNNDFNITVYKIALSLLLRIFKDFKIDKHEITHILEYVRQRSKDLLMNVDEIGTILDLSRNLEVNEFKLQKIRDKYNLEKESVNDNKANLNLKEYKKNTKIFRPKEILVEKYIVNEVDEIDEFSSFHPYFNI